MPTPLTEPSQNGPPTFGDWVQRQRKGRGWTQEHLAEVLACSVSTLYYIEADARHPSPPLARLLFDAFEVPKDQRPAYTTWAEGGPAPEREAGRLARIAEEDLARIVAAVKEAVDLAFAAHGAPDATRIEAMVERALDRVRPPSVPPLASDPLRPLVTLAVQEYAAEQAVATARLQAGLTAALTPSMILVADHLERKRGEHRWRMWWAGWYRVHVKQQIAAAALLGLLLHGFPVPVADGLIWALVGVLVWASAGVWRYWRPLDNWWDHWDAARDVVVVAVGRTLILPVLTLLAVLAVLR